MVDVHGPGMHGRHAEVPGLGSEVERGWVKTEGEELERLRGRDSEKRRNEDTEGEWTETQRGGDGDPGSEETYKEEDESREERKHRKMAMPSVTKCKSWLCYLITV